MRPIGTVKKLYRYPVKGMRGQELAEGSLGWHGVVGDRRFAFMERDDARSGFPWLTGREAAPMVRFRAAFVGDEVEGTPSIVRVETPHGQTLNLDDGALTTELEALFGKPLQLLRLKRGCFDSMPVSVISQTTIDRIGAEVGMRLDVRRFRPNLLLELDEGLSETEDDWLGRQLVLGKRPDSPRLRLDRQNARCVMITLDPDTGENTPKILKAVAQGRANCAGVYATPEITGPLRAGERVFLLD